MTRILAGSLVAALLLSGCGPFNRRPVAVSETPPLTTVVRDAELVPVQCEESVTLDQVDSDGLLTTQSLEEKAYRLTRSDAQHRKNAAMLESAALKCGVKVNRR